MSTVLYLELTDNLQVLAILDTLFSISPNLILCHTIFDFLMAA